MNVHIGAALGLTSGIDVSNGGCFWDGKDINYNEHYTKWGLTFAHPSHNIWGQVGTTGKAQLTTTAAHDQTIFSKFQNQGAKWYISK